MRRDDMADRILVDIRIRARDQRDADAARWYLSALLGDLFTAQEPSAGRRRGRTAPPWFVYGSIELPARGAAAIETLRQREAATSSTPAEVWRQLAAVDQLLDRGRGILQAGDQLLAGGRILPALADDDHE